MREYAGGDEHAAKAHATLIDDLEAGAKTSLAALAERLAQAVGALRQTTRQL